MTHPRQTSGHPGGQRRGSHSAGIEITVIAGEWLKKCPSSAYVPRLHAGIAFPANTFPLKALPLCSR